MKNKTLSVEVKLKNILNENPIVVLDIFGKKFPVGINMFVISIKDDGHTELAFEYTKYQNGSTKVEPIFCVRDYNVTPKEFVNQFNKVLDEADKKYEKDKSDKIKKLGYVRYPFGYLYKKTMPEFLKGIDFDNKQN
jgi:hypothetical protein